MLRAHLLALLAALAFQASAAPSDPPQIAPRYLVAELPGIVRVARAYLGITAPGGCSGVLVTPRHVLTAAHCTRGDQPLVVVVNPANVQRRMVFPVTGAVQHPENLPDLTTASAGTDLGLLTLAADVPAGLARPIPIAAIAPDRGEPSLLAGFPNGTTGLLHTQFDCDLFPVIGPTFGSDCRVVSGFSGGAVLRETAGGWVVVAIMSATIDAPGSTTRALVARIDPATFPALADALGQGSQIAPTVPHADRP